ncbi:MAG: glycosyltransferase [Ignavibacteriae bacterium]|nr:glycosyltransferase [Ignavibacteriota bacterium]MCB9206025.1 glycosyltransferase [Ignavibacteriales bacterium]MCB9209300.1 glycosyltransferase [Ignavibacteriales bacterium]MCB9257944.1 glycosyltransferase [Ignavibacteriales bacterium]
MIIILLIIFTAILLNYLTFLVGISKGIKNVSKQVVDKSEKEFISVIIPFRNEESNILACLKSITSQDYPINNYEVIYIDDNSEDNSLELLEMHSKPDNIKLLRSEFDLADRAHKKKALKFAIENSKGDIIITTDADCIHGKSWLKIMSEQFDENTAFVSGPVEFTSDGSLFSELQKIEFSSLIIVGAGLIGINNPIICNAANLGFRKSVFNEVGGYEDNLNLSSGDDEFLMQKIFRLTDYKIKFCLNSDAISHTNPNKTLNEFYQQRKRWASKGFHYVDNNIVFKLILIFLFYLSIPIQLLLGIFFDSVFLILFIINLLLKIGFEFKIVQIDSQRLFRKAKNFHFLLAEFLHIPYIIISGISGIFGNYKWKGREIKR